MSDPYKNNHPPIDKDEKFRADVINALNQRPDKCKHINRYSLDTLPPQVSCVDCGKDLSPTQPVESLDTILKRLVADIDDAMEMQGTRWSSNERAADLVQKALARATRLIQVLYASEMSSLDQEIVSLKARLLEGKK